MRNQTKKYVTNNYKKIEGWFSKLALELISEINTIQINKNIKGSLCEIGVHHGRSFILLCLLSNDNEPCIAIDLFEDQHQNIDNSGCGDKNIFLRNLEKFNCNMDKVKIITGNSMDIKPDGLLELSKNKFRFFTLDGGHTSEIVQNDLHLAESVLCDGGVILLDDYFDEKWPGVSEGALKYLLNSNSNLVPFAIFDDKILFTNSVAISSKYKSELIKLVPKYLIKEAKYFGETCLVIYNSGNSVRNFLRKTYLWQIIKNNKTGKKIRSMIR